MDTQNAYTLDTLANIQSTAATIDREVASGRALSDVVAEYSRGTDRFWVKAARPYSKALATA